MPQATHDTATPSPAPQPSTQAIARVILQRTFGSPVRRLLVSLGDALDVAGRPFGMACCIVPLPDNLAPRMDAWREGNAFTVRVGRWEMVGDWGLDCGLPRWWSSVKAQAAA